MSARSDRVRRLLAIGTLVGLGIAAYFGWHLLKKPVLADTVTASEQAFVRGETALDAKDGPGAVAALDEALVKIAEVLRRVDELQSSGKLKPEDSGKLEAVRGTAYLLKARALRDRAFAKGLADGKPIAETLDTTTREHYRNYWAMPDEAVRKEALAALNEALLRAPTHPEIVREVLRVRLSLEPTRWADVAPLAKATLEKTPTDSRANYLLARIEFEQFDDKNQPTPVDKRDADRVLKARQYLAASKATGNYPVWRTLDLDVRIALWLMARPGIRGAGFDPGAEADRLRGLLFDPKTGALVRAAAADEFDALSRFDVIGIVDLHRRAIEVAENDARTVPGPSGARLPAALRALLAITRTLTKDPRGKSQALEIVRDLTESAAAARPTALRIAPVEWEAFHKELDDFCRSAVTDQTCGATASSRLADLHLADADAAAARGDAPAVTAAEDRARDWLLEAARWPQTSPAVRAATHSRLLDLKVARGVPAADWDADLKALAASQLPRALAARAFFSAVLAVQDGRLQEAYGLFGQAAGVEDGGPYKLRAFATIPGLALVLGRLSDATNFARELDRGWDALATLDRFGRAWVASQVAGRDEAVAIAVVAQYRTARARVEKERKDKPGKTPAADLTKGTERAAEAALGRLPPKAAVALPARLAQLEFLASAGRLPGDVRVTADVLRADFPAAGAAVLRAEFPAADPDHRKTEDAQAKQAAKTDKLFWPEWLAATGRTADAATAVEAAGGPGATALARLVGQLDGPSAGAALVRAAGADTDPGLLTAERAAYSRMRDGVIALADGKMTDAARAFQAVSEVPALKVAAVVGKLAAGLKN